MRKLLSLLVALTLALGALTGIALADCREPRAGHAHDVLDAGQHLGYDGEHLVD